MATRPHKDALQPGRLRCPRCGRALSDGPLSRPSRCSPKDWVMCLRTPSDVIADWKARGYELSYQVGN
jgi:hypothetical protein